MIAYTRTTREGARLIRQALGDIPHMLIASRRTAYHTEVLSEGERIAYDLELNECFIHVPVELSNRLIVIESARLQDAQVRELTMGLRGVRWKVLDGIDRWGEEWAYRDARGVLRFRLRLMRKPRVFEGKTVSVKP